MGCTTSEFTMDTIVGLGNSKLTEAMGNEIQCSKQQKEEYIISRNPIVKRRLSSKESIKLITQND